MESLSKPKLFARDIMAFSDVELDRYLEENDRCIDVADRENPPSGFRQWLQDYVRRKREAVESRPVDMDQVAARLLQAPAYQAAASRQSSLSRTATPPSDEEQALEEEYQDELKIETEAYHFLVRDGARPPFPIEHFEDIIKNKEAFPEHQEMLSYWADSSYTTGMIPCFSGLLGLWEHLRILQNFAREHKFESEWMLFMVADLRNSFLNPVRHKLWPSTRPVDLPPPESKWEEYYSRSNLSLDKPTDRFGLPEYTNALRRRLARHGFTRTFELDEDPSRQDKLTTWIEFLNYIIHLYERSANFVRRHQRRYDKEWKKLVEAGISKPGETEESLLTIENGMQRELESRRAKDAVKSAQRDVDFAEKAISDSQRLSRPVGELQQSLQEAQSKWKAAMSKHESIERRSNLIQQFVARTRTFTSAQKDSAAQSILMRWTLKQVPLIELESASLDIAQSNTNSGDDSVTSTLGHGEEEQGGKPGCRSQTHVDGKKPASDGMRSPSTFQSRDGRKRRNSDAVDYQQPPKRRRRDAPESRTRANSV